MIHVYLINKKKFISFENNLFQNLKHIQLNFKFDFFILAFNKKEKINIMNFVINLIKLTENHSEIIKNKNEEK